MVPRAAVDHIIIPPGDSLQCRHDHHRSTRRSATPDDADPVRQRGRSANWPRCRGWSCATASDLLFCFPRDYHDASRLLAIPELQEDQPASVCGEAREEIDMQNTGTGKTLLGVLIRQVSCIFRVPSGSTRHS